MQSLKERSIIIALTIVNSLAELTDALKDQVRDTWTGCVFMWNGFKMIVISIVLAVALIFRWILGGFRFR